MKEGNHNHGEHEDKDRELNHIQETSEEHLHHHHGTQHNHGEHETQKINQKEQISKNKQVYPEHHHEEKPHTMNSEHSGHSDHSGHVGDFKKRFYISLIISIPILILSQMIQHFLMLEDTIRFKGDSSILFFLSSFVYFYGGYPFLKGFIDETKKLKPGMMTLIALAITVAYVYSAIIFLGLPGMAFFWEIATLIDIMLLGHWLEMKSVMGASRALEELARLLPAEAHKINDEGHVADIPLEEIKKGDRILIKPGEKIPADGKVIEGKSSVNEAMLTGESKPVNKEKGSEVIGGSLNGEGAITIEINRTGAESFLSRVIDLVNQAQQSKSKTQHLADRAAFWLTLVAIIAGMVTFFIWNVFASGDVAFALERTVTVMVITCPHALGLAIPLVVAVSTGLAARNGFLIRNRTAFENARKINAIIFDKTGTLTEGNFEVTDVYALEGYGKEELMTYAAAVESNSQHPIAQGILRSITERLKVTQFNSLPGKGIEGIVDGKKTLVVSPGYLIEKGITINEELNKYQDQGKTVVHVLIEERYAGGIALGDKIRQESYSAISRLKEMGIKTILLTGDNKQTAEYVARELKMDETIAEVLPDQKSNKVKEVQKEGFITAMTGDGVNDAPALAQADIGIAIGAGSDVAVETADIVLIKNNPNDVAAVIALSRSTYKKMVQNLWWATGYNIFAIPLAAGVLYSYGILLSPALGAVLMSVSTIVVAINAKLLKL